MRLLTIKLTVLVIINLMAPSYAAPIKVQVNNSHEVVILIHGLMRTSASMHSLKNYLNSYGYRVYPYNYPSTKLHIYEHGEQLKQFVTQVLTEDPQIKIHFITHSLGGIITREALAKLNEAQLRHIGYVVMLAPPNQGSFLAKVATKLFPVVAYAVTPLAELSSDSHAYVHKVPVPKIKMGIIAGKFDAKVPPSSAQMLSSTELVIVNAAHTFIMNNDAARQFMLQFLQNGTFKG